MITSTMETSGIYLRSPSSRKTSSRKTSSRSFRMKSSRRPRRNRTPVARRKKALRWGLCLHFFSQVSTNGCNGLLGQLFVEIKEGLLASPQCHSSTSTSRGSAIAALLLLLLLPLSAEHYVPPHFIIRLARDSRVDTAFSTRNCTSPSGP